MIHRAGLRMALLAAGILAAGLPPGPARADIQAATAAYQAGEYQRAFALLEPLAVQGDPQAQFLLGRMYAEGQGLLRDYSRAHTWLTLAANNGVNEALYAKSDVAGRMSTRDIIASMERQTSIADGTYELASAAGPAEGAGTEGAGAEVAVAGGGAAPTAAQQQAAEPAQTTPAAADDGIDDLSRRDLVRAVQEELNRLGFDAGTPDGLFGPSTRSAIQAFEKSAGREAGGEATPDLLRALRAADSG